MWGNEFSDNNWGNCTNADYALKIVSKGIEKRLQEYNLAELLEKFRNRSLRIFEVGSGNGEFLKALQNAGFQNIRGLDMNPRHTQKYPELDLLIDATTIEMRTKAENEMPYDLVYSSLLFDEDCYPDQKTNITRKDMLKEVHGLLQGNGLYYGREMNQEGKISSIIKSIFPRANSLVGNIDLEFIPSQNKA